MVRYIENIRGSVAIMTGACAIPLLLACGVAVDYAAAQLTKTRLQAAADAAVLAAVSSKGSDTQRVDKATAMFARQMAEYQGLLAGDPKLEVKIEGNSAEASANIRQETLLMHLVGIDQNPVRVEARASRRPGKPACMLALDTDSSDSITLAGNPDLIGEDCVVHSNSEESDAIHLQGSASAEADQFCAVGGFETKGSGFTPAPTGNCPKIDDPLTALPKPAIACPGFPNSYAKGTHFLQPGVYCGGLEARTHAEVHLDPGVYVIQDGQLAIQAQAKISGEGVTFYLSGTNSGFDLRGGGSIDVSAPKDGPYRGLVVAQDPLSNPGGTSIITGGGDIRFVGTIYLPTQTLSLQGNGEIGADSPAWSMVAARFTMQGNPEIHIRSDFEDAGYGEPLVKSFGGVVLTN